MVVLALVAMVVTSALIYTATRFLGSLQLTTVTWEPFDVKTSDEPPGPRFITRTFEGPKTPPTRSSNSFVRMCRRISSPGQSHEYGLLSARVLTIEIPKERTVIEEARIVPWKELCQQSKTRGLHTIKVPLLSSVDDILHLSLRQIDTKRHAPYSTPTHLAPRYESEYPAIYIPDGNEESCDRTGFHRRNLYVLLTDDLLDHGPGPGKSKLSFDYDSLGRLRARSAKAMFGDRINMPDIFERNTYKHDED
jgi:hypothetical protein